MLTARSSTATSHRTKHRAPGHRARGRSERIARTTPATTAQRLPGVLRMDDWTPVKRVGDETMERMTTSGQTLLPLPPWAPVCCGRGKATGCGTVAEGGKQTHAWAVDSANSGWRMANGQQFCLRAG